MSLLITGFVLAAGLARADAFPGGSQYNWKAATYLTWADIDIRAGDIEAAEKQLRRAVREDPGSEYLRTRLADLLFRSQKYRDVIRLLESSEGSEARTRHNLYLGLARRYSGDPKGALEAFDRILDSPDAEAGDLVHVGRILNSEEEYRDAIRFFERAEALDPGNVEAWTGRGESHLALEESDAARTVYEKAVEIDPEAIRNWLILAQLAESEERWEDALDLYGNALGLARQPGSLLQSILRVSQRLGDFARAIELTEGLVEKYPKDGPILGTLGVLYYQAGELKAANRVITRAIDEGVDSFQLYLTLGRSLMELDKPEDALPYLEKAVERKPVEFLGWINLALAQFSMERYEYALESLDRAEAIQPESGQALYLRGVILSRQERYVEAIDPFERALVGAPENTDALFGLAVACERTDSRSRAVELLQKILEIDPDDAQALNYLGYMWAERGERLDEAERLIVRAVELEPENGYYLDSLAWVHFQRGRYDDALEEILRSIENAHDDPVIYEHLGDIQRRLGRIEEARKAWQRSLELDPDNPEVSAKLEEIQGLP